MNSHWKVWRLACSGPGAEILVKLGTYAVLAGLMGCGYQSHATLPESHPVFRKTRYGPVGSL